MSEIHGITSEIPKICFFLFVCLIFWFLPSTCWRLMYLRRIQISESSKQHFQILKLLTILDFKVVNHEQFWKYIHSTHNTSTVLTIHPQYSQYISQYSQYIHSTRNRSTVLAIHQQYSQYIHSTHSTHNISTVLTIHPQYSQYIHSTRNRSTVLAIYPQYSQYIHSTHNTKFQHNSLQIAHLKAGNNCKDC